MNRVKGPWSMLYVYAYTRARNNIKVSSENRLQMSWNPPETNPSTNQRLSKNFAKKYKKVGGNIWQICCKAVILHPLSREKRGWVEMLNKGTETWASTSKKLFWKFLLKSFVSSKISLTFASAFQKKAIKKSSLKDLDISKQVVQDLSEIWQITETVNT